MTHILDFFGALKDWLKSLDSPSGLSKTWAFLQVVNLFYETGSQIIVPVTGERTAFTVTRLKEVKNFADLVEKAKKENIILKSGEDIESDFRKLNKKKNFPFFASEGQIDTSDKSQAENLETFLNRGGPPNEVTVVRLTEIRDPYLHNLTTKEPSSKDGKLIFVPRDGSHSTSLILLVHSQSSQTASENKLDKLDTQIAIPTPNANLAPPEVPSQLAEAQFRLFRNGNGCWNIEKEDAEYFCFLFSKKIFSDYLISYNSNFDMSVWQRMLALLLIKVDALLKVDKVNGPPEVVSVLKEFSKKKCWKEMQISAEVVLKKSLIESLKPILISLEDPARKEVPRKLAEFWKNLCDEDDSFEDLFGTNSADGKVASTTIRCPICAIGYEPEVFLKHTADHEATYSKIRTAKTKVKADLPFVCIYCPGSKAFPKDKGLHDHVRRLHKHMIPAPLLVPGGKTKCSHCLPTDDRQYNSQISYLKHLGAEHRNLTPQPSGPRKSQVECSECSLVFSTERTMVAHMDCIHLELDSHQMGPRVCTDCGKPLKRGTTFRVHKLFCRGNNSNQPSSSKRSIDQSEESSKSKKISSSQKSQ